MDSNPVTCEDKDLDQQSGALLDRVHASGSIVDSLLAMPLPEENEMHPEWNAALARRLERKLVDAMRSILAQEERPRKSA